MTARAADVPCAACGTAFTSRVPYPSRADAPLKFTDIALCGGCGLGMAIPPRTQRELDAFYASGDYWSDTVGASRVQTLHERNQCRHRVRVALAHAGDTEGLRLRVLDIGAGHGWTAHWLERLAPAALEAFDFVEPDDRLSSEIVRRHPAARRVEGLPRAAGPYHLIFLNHVLEHVADPVAALGTIHGLLARDGVAYIEMPHADYRFKSDVFPHTWFFTHDALAALARRAGLTQVLRESFGRFPTSSADDLARRAAFRAAATLKLESLAGFFDDKVWRYDQRDDGMWLRWLVRRAHA